jgi:hypothetical protein
VIFVLDFVYMLCYIHWFVYVKPFFSTWHVINLSWCVIVSMWCWIWFTSILLRNFAWSK